MFVKLIKNRLSLTVQRTFSFDSSSHKGIKLIKNLSGSRCISANKSLVFGDNKKIPSSTNDKIIASPQDDHPVEDLVNAPTVPKTLEINTNKGKLVVTTSSTGTELKNVVLEVKPIDKKETESAKSDDVDDPAKKIRVSCFRRLIIATTCKIATKKIDLPETRSCRFQPIVAGKKFHNSDSSDVGFSAKAVRFGKFAENETQVTIRTGTADYGLLAQRC